MDTKEILLSLVESDGVSGDENETCIAAKKFFPSTMKIRTDRLGNLIAERTGEEKRFLLEAHIDKVGFIVTGVNKRGFIKFDKCGGADRRVTVGSEVTVLGKERLFGVVCSVPPHLSKGEGKLPEFRDMAIDIGLGYEEASRIVSPGDRIVYRGEGTSLLGDNVSACGLDNRAGVAAVIKCVEILEKRGFNGNLTVLLSTREEVNSAGAKTASFSNPADEAIIVDVTFGVSPVVSESDGGRLGSGPLIGFSPTLDRKMSEEFIKVGQKYFIPCSREVMGSRTGTTADHISVSGGGIPSVTVSIPIRNMHTPVETVSITDIDNTARLIAEYIFSEEVEGYDSNA